MVLKEYLANFATELCRSKRLMVYLVDEGNGSINDDPTSMSRKI